MMHDGIPSILAEIHAVLEVGSPAVSQETGCFYHEIIETETVDITYGNPARFRHSHQRTERSYSKDKE